MAWEFEMVAGPFNPYLTEGPAWDGKALLFTHIPSSRIMRYEPGTGVCSVYRENTRHTNGLAFDCDGKLYGACAGGRCIVRFEPDGQTTTIVEKLEGAPLNTPNDLAIDRQGRIWFSNPWNWYANPWNVPAEEKETSLIPHTEEQVLTHNSILRADPKPDGTWTCRRMTFDTTGTNGLAISPDQRTLYMIQDGPPKRELRAYEILDDGSLGRYAVLHQFGEDYRGPQRGIDGMCLDAEGNIVGAAGSYAGGPGPMIYVWDGKGRVLETHPMPKGIDYPTNCAFGDPDQRTLYVTTRGGHLFRVRNTGHRGWSMWPPVM